MGINIKELEPGIYLFQFYHREDKLWVLNGGPWNFDNAMLLVESIPTGEDPLKVPLWWLNIWIQIHDLSSGFMSEAVGMQLGNFFGEFISHDPKNNSSIWRECMRTRIRLDVRKSLKRKKKIRRKNGTEFVVTCKYERLGDFCFKCGLVTHTERFCRKSLDIRSEGGVQEWGSWLRAPPRRGAGQGNSKWLREEDDVGWAERVGRGTNCPIVSGENSGDRDRGGVLGRDGRSTGEEDSKIISSKIIQSGSLIISGAQSFVQITNGLFEEEDIGLNIEDRKRQRIGPLSKGPMDTDDVILNEEQGNISIQLNEAVLSHIDCTISNKNDVATLAVQASSPL